MIILDFDKLIPKLRAPFKNVASVWPILLDSGIWSKKSEPISTILPILQIQKRFLRSIQMEAEVTIKVTKKEVSFLFESTEHPVIEHYRFEPEKSVATHNHRQSLSIDGSVSENREKRLALLHFDLITNDRRTDYGRCDDSIDAQIEHASS